MTAPNLAKIELVQNLRETWPNEAQNFTPWLAENLDQLGEALGMDLELQQVEAAVGEYSLDILATDLHSNRPVIIENQLEATDHTHLGQLLTYAAGFDAEAIVWVTRQFRDEHRQALDWLNQRTGEGSRFFGIAIELWRIGESLPAPHFNLVAAPNGWRKETVSRSRSVSSITTERSERFRNFFQELIDSLREDHRFTNARKAQPQNWYSFSSGFGQRISYVASFMVRDRQASVEVFIGDKDRNWNLQLLEDLRSYKDEIESDIGDALLWEPLETRQGCRISLRRPGRIEDDDESLTEIRNWMIQKLVAFKRAFDPKLKELVG